MGPAKLIESKADTERVLAPAFRFAVTTGFQTERDKELEDSERRAHSARISSRRKAQFHSKRNRTSTVVYRRRDTYQHQAHFQGKTYKAASPLVLLGQSDPFHSNGIRITPQMNIIMSFMRDAFYPALYFNYWSRSCSADAPKVFTITRPGSIISSTAASRDWDKLVWSLHDEGLGLASLAACSAMAPQLRQATSLIALEMQMKSVRLLRERLQREGETFRKSKVAILQIFWLFEAEALRGNQDAAQVHGKALRDVAVDSFETGVIDLQMLLEILWADTDLAARYMRRTIFSMDWVVKHLSNIWAYIKMKVPLPKQPTHLDVHPTVTDEILRPILIDTRLQILVTQRSFSADECKELGLGDLVFTWVASRSLVDYGCLINRYTDLDEGSVELKLSPGSRYTQACLVLAMMLVHRCLHPLYINDVDIRDTTPGILKRMKRTMLLALSECTITERLDYADAHMWTLYLAALTVRRLQPGQIRLLTSIGINFDRMFVEQANFSGTCTWQQMEDIEQRFVQTEMIQPSGLLWFEDILDQWTYAKLKKEDD